MLVDFSGGNQSLSVNVLTKFLMGGLLETEQLEYICSDGIVTHQQEPELERVDLVVTFGGTCECQMAWFNAHKDLLSNTSVIDMLATLNPLECNMDVLYDANAAVYVVMTNSMPITDDSILLLVIPFLEDLCARANISCTNRINLPSIYASVAWLRARQIIASLNTSLSDVPVTSVNTPTFLNSLYAKREISVLGLEFGLLSENCSACIPCNVQAIKVLTAGRYYHVFRNGNVDRLT